MRSSAEGKHENVTTSGELKMSGTKNLQHRRHLSDEENENNHKIKGYKNKSSNSQGNLESENKRAKHRGKRHGDHHRGKENSSDSSKYGGDDSDLSDGDGPHHLPLKEPSKRIDKSKYDDKNETFKSLRKTIRKQSTKRAQMEVLGALRPHADSHRKSRDRPSKSIDREVLDTNDYKLTPQKLRRRKTRLDDMDGTINHGSLTFRIYAMMHDFKKQLEEAPFEILPLPQSLTREQVKLIFRRGFRPDQINIDEKVSFIPSFDYSKPGAEQDVIFLADDQEPIDFLIHLGFDADEAAIALQQQDVQQRVQAALVEARIWVSFVTEKQGSLIFFLSQVVNEKLIRFFLPMVEAIVNNRITSASQIDAFTRILENLEETKAYLIKDSIDLQRLHTVGPARDKKEIISRFMDLYGTANEASEVSRGRHIDERETLMLEYLVLRYRPALKNHVDLIATYIGHGLLRTKMQLDAAILFIAQHEDSEIDIMELESFCGIDGSIKEVGGETCWSTKSWSDVASSSVSEKSEQDAIKSEDLFVEEIDESSTLVGTILDSMLESIPPQKDSSSVRLKDLFLRDSEGQSSRASGGISISNKLPTIRSEGYIQAEPDLVDDRKRRTTTGRKSSDQLNAEQLIADSSPTEEDISHIEEHSSLRPIDSEHPLTSSELKTSKELRSSELGRASDSLRISGRSTKTKTSRSIEEDISPIEEHSTLRHIDSEYPLTSNEFKTSKKLRPSELGRASESLRTSDRSTNTKTSRSIEDYKDAYESDTYSSGSISTSVTLGDDSTEISSESETPPTDFQMDSIDSHWSSPESKTDQEEIVYPDYAPGDPSYASRMYGRSKYATPPFIPSKKTVSILSEEPSVSYPESSMESKTEPSISSPEVLDVKRTTEGVSEKRNCAHRIRDFVSNFFGGFVSPSGISEQTYSAKRKRRPPFLPRKAEGVQCKNARVRETSSQTEEISHHTELRGGTYLQNEDEVPSNDIGWLLGASPKSRFTIFWNVHSERSRSFAGGHSTVPQSKSIKDELHNQDSRTKNSKVRSQYFTRLNKSKDKGCDNKSHGDYMEK